MQEAEKTELHAAETLLQRGVKVRARAPLLLRLLGKRTIVLTLRQPTGGALLRMGQWYLRCGIPQEQLEQMSVENALLFGLRYSNNIYNALACLLLVDKRITWLLMRPLANYLRESLTAKDALGLLSMSILYGGINDFMNTTRLVKSRMITSPNLGQ